LNNQNRIDYFDTVCRLQWHHISAVLLATLRHAAFTQMLGEQGEAGGMRVTHETGSH